MILLYFWFTFISIHFRSACLRPRLTMTTDLQGRAFRLFFYLFIFFHSM